MAVAVTEFKQIRGCSYQLHTHNITFRTFWFSQVQKSASPLFCTWKLARTAVKDSPRFPKNIVFWKFARNIGVKMME